VEAQTSKRRSLGDRARSPVTHREAIGGLVVIVAAAWALRAEAIQAAKEEVAHDLEQAVSAREAFQARVLAEIEAMRSDVSDVRQDQLGVVSRIDKLTDLLLAGHIRVRATTPAAREVIEEGEQ
jgi:hypothetical protein